MPLKWAALPLLLSLGGGCTFTTRNVATVQPLATTHPVSASAAYRDAQGQILTASDYEVVMPFMFRKDVTSPLYAETETALHLEPELERLLWLAKGDAITKLRIQAVSYSPGAHYDSARMQLLGWNVGIAGSILVVPGLISLGNDNADVPKYVLSISGACLAAGALFLWLGKTHDTPTRWRLRVSGEVVRASPRAPVPAE
ncbi:MAG: hypothetical protein QM756_46055 [Polyangiaceae bacterium]